MSFDSFPASRTVPVRPTAVIQIRTAHQPTRTVRLAGKESKLIAVPLSVRRPVQVEITTRRPFILGRRVVSVQSTIPRFVESPSGP